MVTFVRKVWSVLFVCIAAFIACSALGNLALVRIAPDVFDEKPRLQSAAANSTDIPPDANVFKAFASGALTDAAEESLSTTIKNSIPKHDALMLLTSGLQRRGIETANLVFGYPAFPTYYGSTHFEEPAGHRIGYISYDKSFADPEAYASWTQGVNRIAEENPSIRFAYCQVYTGRHSWFSPTYNLRSTPLSHEYIVETVLANLDENIIVIDDAFRSESDYRNGWFTTDHHWKPQRALRCYNLLAMEMDWTHYEFENPVLVSESWFGSLCRMGLDMSYSSDLVDATTDFSYLSWDNFTTGKSAEREAFLSGDKTYKKGSYWLYDLYYGSVNCESRNNRNPNGRDCLVICDSMARPLKNYIASNYSHTVFRDPCNDAQDLSFQEMIDEFKPDDIIFIVSPGFASVKAKNPDFFSTG